MSTDSRTESRNDSESPVVKFLDSFLQEKNIKWVLTAGMMILLGSSLMMVTRGWNQLDTTWKFLAIVGYTAAIFGAGHWSYHNLALRKTGTGLLALTVLLIPLSFVSWSWIWEAATSTVSNGTALGLLLLNTLVAGYASRKTFAHFLQGHQITFVLSYLALSIAGAIAPCFREIGDLSTWLWSLALWAAFAIGSVKVNRHVFWLTEEHRQPRIFGFFPILLLGGQFLLVFGWNFAKSIPHDWSGFACVLVAIPVLLTADTVARVFQERTGDLVRPIPWPIMLPMVMGLILCAAGICLAGSGLLMRVPYAVVPTAILTAALMTVVARRTGKVAFVWAMLGCITLAYNFSPVFFQELIQQLRDQGASALNESRLPYAFYGLTYLPLIVVCVVAARQFERRGVDLFAKPLRQFCAGISLFLLAISVTHAKAFFPVASVMTGLLAWQANVFRVRRLALAAMIAFLIASSGLVSFANGVLGMSIGSEMYYLFPTLAAATLLIAGPRLSLWIERLSPADAKPTRHFLIAQMPRTVSLLASIGITVTWLTQIGVASQTFPFAVSLFIFGLLAVHSLVWTRPVVSGVVYGLLASELLRLGIAASLEFNELTSLAILIFGTQWFASYILDRFPNHRVTRAWGTVNHTSAFAGLLFATLAFAVPDMINELIGHSGAASVEALRWMRDILLVAWCFDAARRPRVIATDDSTQFRWERRAQPVPAFLGCVCVLGLVGCGLIRIGGSNAAEWLPLAWTLTAASVIPLAQWLQSRLAQIASDKDRRGDYFALRAIALPVDLTMCVILVAFSALQLFFYSTSICAAGYVGLAGLLLLTFLRQQPVLRVTTAVVINWTVLLAAMQFGTHGADHLLELLEHYQADSLWLVAAVSSVSLLLWQGNFNSHTPLADIALTQRAALRLVSAGALLLTLGEPSLLPLTLIAALLAFVLLFASELRSGLRSQDASRVWSAEAIVTAGLGYLLWFGVISLDQGVAMFVLLGLGVAAHVSGILCSRRSTTQVLSKPLTATGCWLPLVAVMIGVVQQLGLPEASPWLGMNSLAILLAGGFYFWQAIERQSKGFAVLSAAILNVAVLLLWSELKLSDPQFYMIPVGLTILILVEVLKREIPTAWHNPLRYAGALTILVSPTFHIVDQTWLHLIALMVLATCVLLISIGLRLRALMYTGAAFLIADLIAMVICGGIDHPNLLWIAGIGFGAAIITLGAICENNRERLLQRMRIVSAQMEQWN
ncbi:MAG: hypothetical protein O3C40_06210 [Planctomycetota bacterium]|nr:hypothetical protein [Planctomycetota bacterium]